MTNYTHTRPARHLRDLDDRELMRELAHARNRRDAYAAGKEPAEVMRDLRYLLAEQERRRAARRAARQTDERMRRDRRLAEVDDLLARTRALIDTPTTDAAIRTALVEYVDTLTAERALLIERGARRPF